MKIDKIQIDNYRILKCFEIDLEHDLSLVIGKNNCGKTSLLSALERFLLSSQNNFSLDDFNIECQAELKSIFESREIGEDFFFGISLKIYISYDEYDNLANLSSLMLNLNPDENIVIVNYEYAMYYPDALRLQADYDSFLKNTEEDDKKDFLFFLKRRHNSYFNTYCKALEYGNEQNYILIEDRKIINKILNFKRIKAKREVVNSDGTKRNSDKTLSKLSSEYYDKVYDNNEEDEKTKDLRTQLSKTDVKLTEVYEGIFLKVVEKVKRFGGIKEDESIIQIISSLEEKNILKENTSVIYSQSDHSLPEDYNGLGYMNLIAMIFEIEVVINDFRKKKSLFDEPADINLFFIEEPEAHTHPQMQYVFIKNIKSILEEEAEGAGDDVSINLQTVITTHSSHITAESNFDDVKYFYQETGISVKAKNLKDLKNIYEEDSKEYGFLRQYLTLTRAELFFADKAVLIEGDTERILFPTVMKKLDIELEEKNLKENILPLLSQNISVVEVGAYTQIFEKFIDFLDVKALIITDLDTVDVEKKACPVQEGVSYSNSALSFFFNEKSLEEIKSLSLNEKCLSKTLDQENQNWVWKVDHDNPRVCVVFQLEENNFHGRSFEDCFIHLNRDFVTDNKEDFRSLKNRALFDDVNNDAYVLANRCVNKKTHFALDILFHSDENFENWQIPAYIKEGLLWLKN